MNFNRVAGFYPWMEFFMAGNLMHRCRTAYLADCRQRRRALLVGEGTGKFLAELLRTNPSIHITCVEHSEKMIRQIRQRLQRHQLDASRVRFENADFLQWSPQQEPFDLIVTHFFLDCFGPEELPYVIAKLAAAATPDAVWLFSDFQFPDRGLFRLRAQLIIGSLYKFFRLTAALSAKQLIAPDPWIQQNGFVLQQRRSFSLGLTHTDLWRKAKE